MGTKVQNVISTSTKSQPNMSQAPSQPHSSSQNQQHSRITQTSTHQTTSTKKKKKKKTASTPALAQPVGVTKPPSQSISYHPNPVNTSEHASGSSSCSAPDSETTEQWQQRVQSLRTALNKAQKENQLLITDLAAALARASDAEHAEDTVNKGLLTARSVISQRDRTIAELKSMSSNLRADLTHLQEEKKKTDKRRILLKTVSANLQEARESRDAAEKKLEEANSELSNLEELKTGLGKDVESLKQHVETMEMVKQQLARREIENDELSRAKHRVEEEARQREMRAFGVGVISTLAVGIVMRVLGKGPVKDKE